MGLLDFKNTLQQVKRDLLEKPKEALLGQKAKLLKQEWEEQDNFIEFDPEESFDSIGASNLTRYYQGLYYDPDDKNPPYIYGMDCNACCTMYFLQSYGLIPPNMSRKQFEYLFTPLNPPKAVNPLNDKSAYAPNSSPKTNEGIKWEGKIVKPAQDNLFKGLFDSSEGFLRGLKGSGAILPHTPKGIEQLYTIVGRFYSLAQTNEYKFLEKSLKGGYYSLNYEGLSNKYSALQNGIEDNYFQKHVIFVDLALGKFDIEHYCLVVGNSPQGVVQVDTDIYLRYYKVDDPLFGKWDVPVPTKVLSQTDIAKLVGKVSFIYPNAAIGV
ncbi:MAG: hypothetical protein SFU27_00185 [Thermonemataceae bacterium]|nr:hypothetical protein [Thermonemataceae bacterium]